MKEYIGSQEHFEDCVNEYYDQKEAYEKDMRSLYEEQPDPRIQEYQDEMEEDCRNNPN